MVSHPECRLPAPHPNLLILSLSKDEDALIFVRGSRRSATA
jgi:hypothetical protein